MSKNILEDICNSKKLDRKLLAVLIDPDKWSEQHLSDLLSTSHSKYFDLIFIGGSEIIEGNISQCLNSIDKFSSLPKVIFPGHPEQIDPNADALLLLSLLSSRNSDFLIGHQVQSARKLKNSGLEIIPTAYIHIGNHQNSAVSRVTESHPIPESDIEQITSTAITGELLGFKMIYLEAGSGSGSSISSNIINTVKNETHLPLIVGGGIKSYEDVKVAWNAGADIVVVGTALETNPSIFF